MKVTSLNIGRKQSVEWKGKQVETGIFKFSVDHSIFLGKEDVKDDDVVDRKYHGGIDKACYLYGKNHYPFWLEKYPNSDLQYGAFGENITIEYLDESTTLIGAKYQLGKAIVEISQPRQPCFKLGIRFNNANVVKDFFQSPFPGVYVRVIEEGDVNIDDEMKLIDAPKNGITVAEVHSLFSFNRQNKLLGEKAISEEKLAISYKKDLIKMFK